jgi:thiamine biosynthesis protein ThiI
VVTSIVVHYQEIALKGKNRPWFLGRLVRNLRRALSDLDVLEVRALMGRIEIRLGPGTSREAAGERVRRTFGIANFSFARRTVLDIDALAGAILDDLGDRTSAFDAPTNVSR